MVYLINIESFLLASRLSEAFTETVSWLKFIILVRSIQRLVIKQNKYLHISNNLLVQLGTIVETVLLAGILA